MAADEADITFPLEILPELAVDIDADIPAVQKAQDTVIADLIGKLRDNREILLGGAFIIKCPPGFGAVPDRIDDSPVLDRSADPDSHGF